jgi:cell pole-organizing protein PopZ
MTEPTPPEASPEPSMEEILASIRQIISEDLASTAAAEGQPRAADADDDLLVLKNRAPPEPSPFAPVQPEPVTAEAPPAPTEAVETEAAEVQAADPRPTEARAAEAEATPVQAAGVQATGIQDAAPPPADARPAQPEAGARSLTVAPSAELAVVEPATAAAVAASFERLSFVVENTPPSPPFPVSAGGGTTLEDIARDVLTPVIKAWLDENLPEIVRARVDEEVERITRGRVR